MSRVGCLGWGVESGVSRVGCRGWGVTHYFIYLPIYALNLQIKLSILINSRLCSRLFGSSFVDMQPSKIDIFGHELIITSMNRSRIVTLDKFVGLVNSSHHTSISSVLSTQAMHVGDVSIVHPAKLYLPDVSKFVCLF